MQRERWRVCSLCHFLSYKPTGVGLCDGSAPNSRAKMVGGTTSCRGGVQTSCRSSKTWVLAVALIGRLVQASATPPLKLIIDTDIGGGGCNDVDDVVAICEPRTLCLTLMPRPISCRPFDSTSP